MNYKLHILTAANNKDEMAHHNEIIIMNFLGFKRGRKKIRALLHGFQMDFGETQ